MKSRANPIEEASRASGRRALLDALRPACPSLTLPDIKRLTQLLHSFQETGQPLKTAVVHTYTTELLRPYWAFETALQGFELGMYEAPYGSILQELQPDSALLALKPDVTYFFLRWEDLNPRLGQPLPALSRADQKTVTEDSIDYLLTVLGRFRQKVPGLLVLTLLPRFSGPVLGNYDAMVADSEASYRAGFKTLLTARIRESLPGVCFDDFDTLVEDIGRRQLFDPRLWLAARFPFSVFGAQAVVERLVCYAVLLKQPKVKCIVVDADNTLWGGIVGEDGPTGIALGPEYPGSAYCAFQKRLLEFQQRGLLLAMCSKNNPQDVMEILTKHPHQILRGQHFAALRINWQSKTDNLREIAEELNIGLESFVFVDDSPHERHSVRQQLPQITVVGIPEQLADLPFCLDHLPQLEIMSLTQEDRQRTELYAQEGQRRQLALVSRSLDEYLASLHMIMVIGLDDHRHVARIAQLTQRTNQFNLTTHRYTEGEVQRFISEPDWLVAHFSLSDIFGDSGLVGVALVRGLSIHTAEVDTFLMSCRVIGRQAETAFLHHLLKILSQRGISSVRASYIPTAKNEMVKDFWLKHGFATASQNAYEIDLREWSPPISPLVDVRVDTAESKPAKPTSP